MSITITDWLVFDLGEQPELMAAWREYFESSRSRIRAICERHGADPKAGIWQRRIAFKDRKAIPSGFIKHTRGHGAFWSRPSLNGIHADDAKTLANIRLLNFDEFVADHYKISMWPTMDAHHGASRFSGRVPASLADGDRLVVMLPSNSKEHQPPEDWPPSLSEIETVAVLKQFFPDAAILVPA